MMLGLNVLGNDPGGILVFGDDPGASQRCWPAGTGDPDGKGDHRCRFISPVAREIIKPALGNVHDDTHPRPRRQDEFGRNDDRGSLAGQPDRHPRIGAGDFIIAEVIMPGDVQQGIAGVSRHHLQPADEVAAIGWQRKRRAPDWGDPPRQQQDKYMQAGN